jgi:hypothetical protein
VGCAQSIPRSRRSANLISCRSRIWDFAKGVGALSNIWRCALIVDRRFPTIAIFGALIGLSAVSVSAQQMNRPDLPPPVSAVIPRPPVIAGLAAPEIMPAALRPNNSTPQLVSSVQAKTAIIARPEQMPRGPAPTAQAVALVDPLAGHQRPDQATNIERVQSVAATIARPSSSQIR